ncbi:hypothetical protein C4559_04735 [Candidatus Microgenomates bacterium]|nr:MAG: hypothetical protein C4559_04735 [Candidatus Microgenomates bacterium]
MKENIEIYKAGRWYTSKGLLRQDVPTRTLLNALSKGDNLDNYLEGNKNGQGKPEKIERVNPEHAPKLTWYIKGFETGYKSLNELRGKPKETVLTEGREQPINPN